MNSIPLCDEMRLSVKDEKVRTFHLRYLTELDKQVRYMELTGRESEEIEAIKKTLPLGEMTEDEQTAEAWDKLQENRRKDIRKYLSTIDEYINLFVCGWEGAGLFPFPENVEPARALKLYEKFPLYRLIQENIGELTGLTGDEIKN
jgi:hypothetical protein